MARHLRVEYPGAIYHVACRMIGDGRLEESRLFVDDVDRQRFVNALSERVERYNIRLYLFVLMTNHFHLVFETPEGNCSKFMQALTTAYTVYYNLRHGRHGHLLDGRYKAKLVDGDTYLLALTRYVHLNPVCVGEMKIKSIKEKIQILRQYEWSSYRGYIREGKTLGFMDYGPMLAEMGGKASSRPKRYRVFVETGLAEEDEEFMQALKASPRSIGGDAFREWVDDLYQKLVDKHGVKEDVSFRRVTEPLDTKQVLEALADALKTDVGAFRERRRSSVLRGIAGHLLIKYGGQTQRTAAELLGMGTGSAVSVQMRNAAAVLAEDDNLRRRVEKAERHLAGLRKFRKADANA